MILSSTTTSKLTRTTASLTVAGLLTLLLAIGLGSLKPRQAQAAEDTCFATIDGATVYSSADASAVQDAVNEASSDETIKVAGTCTGVQTISSKTQTVYISKTITLIGGYANGSWNDIPDPVANPTVLDANSSGRVVYVTSSGNVTLQNLILRNGSSDFGGAIWQSGPVTLETSQISDSTAQAGGAIYSDNSALTITHSSLISNTASTNNGGAKTRNL